MSVYENHSEHFLSEVCDAPFTFESGVHEDATPADVVETEMAAGTFALVNSVKIGKTTPHTASEYMCTKFINKMEQGEE